MRFLVSTLLSAGHLLAAVGTPVSSPEAIPLNVSTVVTITSQISNPSPLPGGVNLLQVDASGNAITIVGMMHDDGLNGDVKAGDGIFTLQTTFKQASASFIYLRVSAAFQGQLKRVLSGVISVHAVGPPVITDFNPKSAPGGVVVTVSGSNFVPAAGVLPVVTLPQKGAGTVTAPLLSANAGSLAFVIPTNAATGPVTISVAGQTSSSAAPLTVTGGAIFTVTALPASISIIQGQSAALAVQLSSANGFASLAQLSVSGLPAGVSATFKPPGITASQISTLTLTAPSTQALGNSTLTVTASANADGVPISQTAPASLTIQAPTTAFVGRTVVSDSRETPLAGVTIKMLGTDGSGNSTGCSGQATSDGAGNFALTGLAANCVGPQLVGFDGTTATSPPGRYAGVNLVYTLLLGQVKPSPVPVHLPRIDNQETFYVTQNAVSDQSHSYASIPGLSLTVYAHTTFTMPDGTQPNPFPLVAVKVPVDRLPDLKPPVPTMINIFIVAFQPANVTASQPVAVYYPNVLNTPPGIDMPLLTLDPTLGKMVPYGTGTVAANGIQVVPNTDPAHPGHLYGIVHFDWHGAMPPPPPQPNPAPPGSGGGNSGGGPASGPGSGPGGGTGPGGPDTGGGGDDQSGNGGGGNNGGSNNGGGNNGGGNNGGTGGNNGGGSGGGGCNTCPCPQSASSQSDRRPILGTQVQPVLAAGIPGQPQQASPDKLLAEPGAQAGDPVDLSTGVQVIKNTDIAFSGSRGGISLVRTYRSLTSAGGPFGVGTNHNYGYALDTAFPQLAATINLVMPDGNRFPFTSHLCAAVIPPLPCPGGLTNITVPALLGASMTVNGDNSVDLRWKNGTVWHFVPASFTLGSLLASITDANGNTITITRDPINPPQITEITDPVGRSLTFTYDGSGRITLITDPIGRTAKYTYNARGSLSTFTNPAGGVTSYDYDANNNLRTVRDPRHILQAQNTLDAQGRVVQQLRPDGGTLTFTYTFANPLAISPALQTFVSESKGVSATYRFNAIGFVTDVAATEGQLRTITRTGTNQPGAIAEGPATNNSTYDFYGNLLSSTDATGLTTKFEYEYTFNKVTRIIDPLGHAIIFAYDSHGNLQKTTDANGNSSSYEYDANGLLTKSTDAANKTTMYGHDPLGNLINVTSPLNETTSYTYDGISRLTATIDSLGRRTSFVYDGMGHLTKRTDPAGGVTSYDYDANGNLTSLTDPGNNATTFTYDPLNRLASRTDPRKRTETRSYDTNGNLIKFVDRRGQTSTFQYDDLNRLVKETYGDAVVSRSYDVLGRLVQITDSAAGVFTYSYDPAGRLLASTTPFGAVNYTYDGRGLMASRQVAGQPAVAYTYDDAVNLHSVAMPQASASFAYNARNQLASIDRLNGVKTAFTYDDDGRLLTLAHAKGVVAIDSEAYAYDAVGNRSSRSTSLGQALITQPTTNEYDAANQLTLFGSVPNSYDGNGNLVQQGTTVAYNWDSRNRLASIVTSAGQTTRFTYDPRGNLIQQQDSGSSLNLTRYFVLDDLTNLVYVAASDGTSYSTLSGRSIDSHFAIVPSTAALQYGLADAINSTVATVDQAGTVAGSALYEPYGQTTTVSTYPFQFTGRIPVSGDLYYYRARFYNTQTGRFISEDPLGPQTVGNLYTYVHNNPVNRLDPGGKIDYLGLLRAVLVAGQLVLSPTAITQMEVILDTPSITTNVAAAELQALNFLVTSAKELIEEMSKDPEADTELIDQLKQFVSMCMAAF